MGEPGVGGVRVELRGVASGGRCCTDRWGSRACWRILGGRERPRTHDVEDATRPQVYRRGGRRTSGLCVSRLGGKERRVARSDFLPQRPSGSDDAPERHPRHSRNATMTDGLFFTSSHGEQSFTPRVLRIDGQESLGSLYEFVIHFSVETALTSAELDTLLTKPCHFNLEEGGEALHGGRPRDRALGLRRDARPPNTSPPSSRRCGCCRSRESAASTRTSLSRTSPARSSCASA